MNTCAPLKVIQQVATEALGGIIQYLAPFISDESDNARYLDQHAAQVPRIRRNTPWMHPRHACGMTGPSP